MPPTIHQPTDRPSSTHAVNLHTFFCMFISLFFGSLYSTMSRLHFALLSPFRSERQEYILIFFKERGNRKDGWIPPPPLFSSFLFSFTVCFIPFLQYPFVSLIIVIRRDLNQKVLFSRSLPHFSTGRTSFIPLD